MHEYALYFLNAANILYVVCYLLRDVLMLRILAVAAMVTIMPFYFFCDPAKPMYQPIMWNFGFMAINVFWIVMIFRERRPPKLSDDEKQLYEMTFKSACSQRDMLRLLHRARWNEVQAGETLIVGNTSPDQLVLIHSGCASVQVEGDEVAKLRSGDMAAEMSFLTGDKAVADVVAEGPMRFVRWQRSELETLFERRPTLKTAIYQLIGHDLVTKLSSSQPNIPELTVSKRGRGEASRSNEKPIADRTAQD